MAISMQLFFDGHLRTREENLESRVSAFFIVHTPFCSSFSSTLYHLLAIVAAPGASGYFQSGSRQSGSSAPRIVF